MCGQISSTDRLVVKLLVQNRSAYDLLTHNALSVLGKVVTFIFMIFICKSYIKIGVNYNSNSPSSSHNEEIQYTAFAVG